MWKTISTQRRKDAESSAEFHATGRLRDERGRETPEECPQEWGHGSLTGYATEQAL